MVKLNHLVKVLGFLGACSLVAPAYGVEDPIIKEAKEDYLSLAMPPQPGNPMAQFTYSGPTEAEAAIDPSKRLQREYVESRSALTEKIPRKRAEVERKIKVLPVDWATKPAANSGAGSGATRGY